MILFSDPSDWKTIVLNGEYRSKSTFQMVNSALDKVGGPWWALASKKEIWVRNMDLGTWMKFSKRKMWSAKRRAMNRKPIMFRRNLMFRVEQRKSFTGRKWRAKRKIIEIERDLGEYDITDARGGENFKRDLALSSAARETSKRIKVWKCSMILQLEGYQGFWLDHPYELVRVNGQFSWLKNKYFFN